MPVSGAEQAVRAYCDASVWEHVLEKPTHKLLGRQRTGFALVRGRLLVLERDVAIFQREDAVVAEGNAEEVPSTISEGVLAAADRHTVHDPVFVPYGLIDERASSSLVPLVDELGAEEHS